MEYWAEQAASGNSTGNPNAAVEVLLTDMVGLLQQLQAQTDSIELTSDQINLNADQINLNTDGVETLLAGIDARAIASALSLSTIQAQLAGFEPLIDGIEGLLANLFTSSTAIETQLSNIESVSGDTNTLLAAIDAKLGAAPTIATLVESFLVLGPNEISLNFAYATAKSILIKGVRNDGSPNAQPIYIGAPGQARFRIDPDNEKTIDSPSGELIDLGQMVVRGAANDGVAILYFL
jgi:hypothetical protein